MGEREEAGAVGEHPSFGRQQTKMDECGKTKVRGEEENKGKLKEQERVVRAVFFYQGFPKAFIVVMIAQSFRKQKWNTPAPCMPRPCDSIRLACSPSPPSVHGASQCVRCLLAAAAAAAPAGRTLRRDLELRVGLNSLYR